MPTFHQPYLLPQTTDTTRSAPLKRNFIWSSKELHDCERLDIPTGTDTGPSPYSSAWACISTSGKLLLSTPRRILHDLPS